MKSRAETVALLMRHCTNVLVAVVMVADPTGTATPAGKALLAALGVWAVYRMVTRSRSALIRLADYLSTLSICLAVPLLVSGPDFHQSNCAPVAVAGTAVISFAVSVPPRFSLPMALGIAACYAFGSAQVITWSRVGEVFNMYYFALQWVASAIVRTRVMRVAAAVDDSRKSRQAAEIADKVDRAVAAYDREQTRLLHDTVASTLLLVGQGTPVPRDRLAAQARRDLDLLGTVPLTPAPGPTELVSALESLLEHVITPCRFIGLGELWVRGETAVPVVAAAREALTNVDRHAAAQLVTVQFAEQSVTIRDDGIGFDTTTPWKGHGVPTSIVGRLAQAGGYAVVTSKLGAGTSITLGWAATSPEEPVDDPDRLIERTRIGYGLALVCYAIANLIVSVPPSISTTNSSSQLVLALVAAICTLTAIPAILGRTQAAMFPIATILLFAMGFQTALLPANALWGQSHWAQSAAGWCLMPLLLRQRATTAATVLIVCWFAPAALAFFRNPTVQVFVDFGLGTASILTVQLFVLLFHALIANAALDARDENGTRVELLAQQRLTHAIHDEYQTRYADLINNVRPLLEALSRQCPIDDAFRHGARLETQRMRTLFDRSANFAHPLLRRLRSSIEAAEARQVDVSVHIEGALPELARNDLNSASAALTCGLDGVCCTIR